MASLRPHKRFNFVGMWKYGFILSGILIALSLAGFIASTVVTGFPLTLGTEFSGGTSIELTDTGDITEEQVTEAFNNAATSQGISTEISSIQTSVSAQSGNGFVIRTTDTESTDAYKIMTEVESTLGISEENVQIETIGASWGASVIWSSILAFIVSCIGILIVIALRYREPRMGVVALITLFHDMIIVLGIYAWAGIFLHMEITSDVIAALLAIIGYSLYDTIVIFHRINKNASPSMKCSLKTCANRSVNEVIVRSMNTSITSIIPVLFMLILGTDTLRDFAFAMVCGMVIGIYSTLAISGPIFTLWKCRQPEYAKLEKKYPYEVEQSPFTKEMMKTARVDGKIRRKEDKQARAEQKRQAKHDAAEKKAAEKRAAAEKKAAEKQAAAEKQKAEKQAAAEKEETAEQEQQTQEAPEEIEEAAPAETGAEAAGAEEAAEAAEAGVEEVAGAAAEAEAEQAAPVEVETEAGAEEAAGQAAAEEGSAKVAEQAPAAEATPAQGTPPANFTPGVPAVPVPEVNRDTDTDGDKE